MRICPAASSLPPLRDALRVLLLANLLATATACARDGAPPVAPTDVTVDVPDGGNARVVVPIASPRSHDGERRCTASLHAATIKTASGCLLDEQISMNPGVLLYPCFGDGPVEAVFGEHRFAGSVTVGALDLALTTELDWQDGCHWETRQGIRGTWRADAKRRALSWTYTERATHGSDCYMACKGYADIEVAADDTPP